MSLTRATPTASSHTADPALLQVLESALPGAVRSRAFDRLAMAHDASHYLLTPAAVVTPTSAADVGRLLKIAAAHGIALTFRSGGTSLSGQAVTAGVLVDTRRNFRGIEVLDSGARVRVQPGATVRQVNARLAAYNTKLGPDPASESACTIGGVVANNSSGMACGTEFNTYRTLESMVIVLASGTVIDTAEIDADAQLRHHEPQLHDELVLLRDRVRGNPDSVRRIHQQFSLKNTMGYGLNSFVDHDTPVDILSHLIIGSEGTLAFVASATFRTIPVRTHLSTGLLVFPDLRTATASLPALVDAGLATIELLDATSLRVAQRDPEADDMLRAINVVDHSALLVEFQETTATALTDRARTGAAMLRKLPLALPAAMSGDVRTRAGLWHIRKGLYATVAGSRPSGTTALLEDIAVPVAALADTCTELTRLFAAHGYEESVIFGHAKDGNIHFLLNERFDQPKLVERYIAFTEDLVQLVLAKNGTLKAEHGTGRIMAPFVRRQYGDELYDVMVAVKRACDPTAALNPGVLINEDPTIHVSNLKSSPAVEVEVDRCVECGYCEPVCPSRDLTTTPRQRIVLRREMARAEQAGDLALLAELQQDYEYDGVQTCAADGMCQTACPVLIDTGMLVKRLRADRHGKVEKAVWKQAAKHWGVAARMAGLALTVAASVPPALVTAPNKLARKAIGDEKIPLWFTGLPKGGTARTPMDSADPQAVYFSACISSLFGPADPEHSVGVGTAFRSLCDRAGVELRVPQKIQQLCCGTPWKSKGLTAAYTEMQERVLPALWEATLQGQLLIVCDAASCTEGLHELIAKGPAQYTSLRVVDAVAFVDDVVLPHLSVGTKLESMVLHPTCSSTRLGTNAALTRLAAAIADDVVIPDGWGCCAFAGDRGMLHPELTASATKTEAVSVAGRRFGAYASTNRTCEIGMTRATGHPYQHILELVDHATKPANDPSLA